MARPSTNPQISQISPDGLSEGVFTLALKIAANYLAYMAPDGRHDSTTCGGDILKLAYFARFGQLSMRAGAVSAAEKGEISAALARVLKSGLVGGEHGEPKRGEHGEPKLLAKVELVLVAVRGRLALLGPGPVQVTDLSAIASVSVRTIYSLVQARELRGEDGLVSGKSARSWLRSRKVAGFCS